MAATATGKAMRLCLVAGRKSSAAVEGKVEEGKRDEGPTRRRRMGPRPEWPPETWEEAVWIAAATIKFTFLETVGKWGISALAFGIKKHMRRHQDRQQFARVYAGSNCKRLKGPEITAKLIHLLRLLNICLLFTKKTFPVFLELSSYSREDVILEEHKAGILKPNFILICDRSSQCFLLFIRGARSIKDKLTAATGEMVPFNHSILHEGQVSDVVQGYAHCGMVAGARWIAKLTTPCLLEAVRENPDYKIKIIGHSMGAGIAAILTCILRKHEEFSSTTCVAFGPASCMTWDLAESGNHFITSIVNCTDVVPTVSPSTVNDLRSEVRAASHSNCLQDQVECTKCCDLVYHFASILGSHLQSICGAKATVSGGEDVTEADSGTCSSLSSCSCMGVHRRATSKRISDSPVMERRNSKENTEKSVAFCSSAALDHKETDEEDLIPVGHAVSVSVREAAGGELWFEGVCRGGGEEGGTTVAKELTGEVLQKEAAKNKLHTLSDALDRHHFYPPGRIMHMMVLPASNINSNGDDIGYEDVGIFETPRELYSKIRLAESMINDHYMPRYIKMMERLISRLKEEDGVSSSSTSPKPFTTKMVLSREHDSKPRRHTNRTEQNCITSCPTDANSLR